MRIISGCWKGHGLNVVRGRGIRPTSDRVREAWMSALGDKVAMARVLDLFAGSGALGLEALSRGAESATFVESANGSLRILIANIERLGAQNQCEIIQADAFQFLKKPVEVFDLAFADPPYTSDAARRLVECFLSEPFAKELWLEHPWREKLTLPGDAQTRRYGDTALSTIPNPL